MNLLIDDDERRWQRRKGATVRARMLVVRDVCEIACGPEHLLAPVHFTRERILHPRDEVRLVSQVGDDRRDMTYPVQANQSTTDTPLL